MFGGSYAFVIFVGFAAGLDSVVHNIATLGQYAREVEVADRST